MGPFGNSGGSWNPERCGADASAAAVQSCWAGQPLTELFFNTLAALWCYDSSLMQCGPAMSYLNMKAVDTACQSPSDERVRVLPWIQYSRRAHVQVLHDSYVEGQLKVGAPDVVSWALSNHAVLGARLP